MEVKGKRRTYKIVTEKNRMMNYLDIRGLHGRTKAHLKSEVLK